MQHASLQGRTDVGVKMGDYDGPQRGPPPGGTAEW